MRNLFIDSRWRSLPLDGTSRWKHHRCSALAKISSARWTSLDWPERRKWFRYFEGNFQAIFNLSQSFSAVRNKSWANFPKILCSKSGWMCLTLGFVLKTFFFLLHHFYLTLLSVDVFLLVFYLSDWKSRECGLALINERKRWI